MFNYLCEYEQFKGSTADAERSGAPALAASPLSAAPLSATPAHEGSSAMPLAVSGKMRSGRVGTDAGSLGPSDESSPGSDTGRLQLSVFCDDDEEEQSKSPAPRLSSPAPLFAVTSTADDEFVRRIRDYEQLDKIIKTEQGLEQLDLFLHRKKFTTSAMSFFLTKVRAPARQRCWPLPEEEMRRRKARRAPPPPGLLAHPPDEGAAAAAVAPEPATPDGKDAANSEWVVVERHSSRGRSNERHTRQRPQGKKMSPQRQDQDARTEAAEVAARAETTPLPEKRTLYSVRRTGSSTRLELECRLEQELEAARERERALEAALKQRSEAFSELFVCPITHEPMQDPVSAADGQTYERRAIEAWLKKGDLEGAVPTSPLTGEPLKDKTLRPNFLARALRAGIS